MSRKLFYILIAISIAASALVAANISEKKEPVYIGPWGNEFTIGPGQTAIFRFGWATCSPGLQEDWIGHTLMTLDLYKSGELIQSISDLEKGKLIWEDPNPELFGHCIHMNEISSARWYFKNLKFNKPGVYTLHFYLETTAQMTDGFDFIDQDGNEVSDGLIDIIPAQVWHDKDVTITVLPGN